MILFHAFCAGLAFGVGSMALAHGDRGFGILNLACCVLNVLFVVSA